MNISLLIQGSKMNLKTNRVTPIMLIANLLDYSTPQIYLSQAVFNTLVTSYLTHNVFSLEVSPFQMKNFVGLRFTSQTFGIEF